MADDERRLSDAAERFDAYLEALLGDGRPSPDSVGDPDEAEMARMAAELAASGRLTGTTVRRLGEDFEITGIRDECLRDLSSSVGA